MNEPTLSLVKLAQELCNSGRTPQEAVSGLLVAALNNKSLEYLQGADVNQAIAELERRFSGYLIKPWESALQELGYALECIRQLVALAEEHETDAAVCVRVAQRFLKKFEGSNHG
ncbi:MAG: hypothetical protein L3K52_13455 [Candidatus Thiothrix sulfatifontis]|nr:MAG: hypothetical protein L3K52_13455 [Candidatus Thiothrix sulfatifontis]